MEIAISGEPSAWILKRVASVFLKGQSPPSSAAPPVAKLAAPLPASSYLPNIAEIESVVSRGKKEHALFTDIEIDVVSVDETTRYGGDLDGPLENFNQPVEISASLQFHKSCLLSIVMWSTSLQQR